MPTVTLLRPHIQYLLGTEKSDSGSQVTERPGMQPAPNDVFQFFVDVPVVCTREIAEKCVEIQQQGKARFRVEGMDEPDPDADVGNVLGIQLEFV